MKNGVLITPPIVERRARGHHPRLGHDDRPRPRLRGARRTTSSAATSTSPTRRSSPAPRPRSCRSARSTTARSASRGEITRKIQETYFAAVRGEVERYKDWLEHVRNDDSRTRPELAGAGRDLRHDAARRRAARGHLAHRRRQAAHRRAARLARRRLHRGGLAGRQPEGRRALPARADRAAARHEHARRVRLDPAGEGQGRLRRHAAPPRRGGHVDGVHRRQGVGLPRARGARHHARRGRGDGRRLGRVPAAPTGARCSSTPSTSSTATSATPSSRLRVLEGAAQAGATALVLCDTNGGTLPARGRAHRRARSSTTSAPTSASACTSTTTPAPASPTRSPACAAARSQVQGTINGYGERTGNCNLTTIIPNLTLKMGIETIPADRLERLTPVAHHVAELVNMALNPQARLRRHVGVRAQGRAARRARSPSAPTPTSTSPPDSVGNGTRFVVSELAGKSTLVLKAKELGLELDGPQLNEVVDTLKHLEHEGYHFEVADASLELLMRRATGWEQRLVRGRVVPGDHRRPRRPTTTPGGVTTEATIKVHVGGERVDRDRRGQRPGERARHRAARRARRPLPGARPRAPHRLQGARARHRSKGTGAVTRVLLDSTDGERSWTTIGVQREHHRGVVAGAVRLARLRPAPGARRAGAVALTPCPPIRSSPPSSTTRPRQEPNLAPGVHMPAAGAWRADRPATSCAGQPTGDAARLARARTSGYALTLADAGARLGAARRRTSTPTTRSRWSPSSR